MISARQCLSFGQGVLVLLLGCATPGSGNRASSVAPRAAPPTADRLPDGPSLRETGRIAAMDVSNSGAQIDAPSADGSVSREQPVESVDAADAAQPAAGKSAGIVDAAALKREIRTRFVELNDCPREVARRTRAATVLRARRLTLRWTILPSGQVAHTAVVATSPVNAGVMDCVKRQMSLWTFAPPKGGSLSVERAFAFRR